MIIPGIARTLSIFLSFLLASPYVLSQAPQKPAEKAVPAEPGPANLSIGILEGKGAVNSLTLLRSIPPVVEVRDINEFPVEGAVVVFTLPASGPGGIFAGGEATFTTRSDARGQAAAPFFTPKGVGKFQIRVTASLGSRKADAVIDQTNAEGNYSGPPIPPKPLYKKKWPIIVAVAGAAAVGVAIVFATRKSGGSSTTTTTTTNTITITPGAPVFH